MSKKKPTRTAVVRFRTQPALRERLEDLAEESNRSLSSFLETKLREIAAGKQQTTRSVRSAQ